MRSPIRRRSISIWLSPGPPRKPKPPRWRSKWVHDRTRRPRWYSSAASSTCRRPSWVRARAPKISRISPVRSITLAFHAFSRLRCCTGVSLSSMTTSPIPCSSTAVLTRSTTPLPIKVAGVTRRIGTDWASRTSRSMARESPTASSSLASLSRRSRVRWPGLYGLRTAATVAGRAVSCGVRWRLSCPLRWMSFVKSAFGFVSVEQLDGRDRHDGRDRMLVDELRMTVAAQQHRKVVEPGDDSLQFDAVDQENRDRRLVLAQMVQEDVLNVLCLFAHVLGLLLGIRRIYRQLESVGKNPLPSWDKYRRCSGQSNAASS